MKNSFYFWTPSTEVLQTLLVYVLCSVPESFCCIYVHKLQIKKYVLYFNHLYLIVENRNFVWRFVYIVW